MTDNKIERAMEVLVDVSAQLGGVDIALMQVQYTAKVLEYPVLVETLKRQRSLLAEQERRIDHVIDKLDEVILND